MNDVVDLPLAHFRVVIKGTPAEARAALAKHRLRGHDFAFGSCGTFATVRAARNVLSAWFAETTVTPYQTGALLHFVPVSSSWTATDPIGVGPASMKARCTNQ